MKDILVRIGAIGGMTVDTLVGDLRILYQRCLVEGREVALEESHLAVYLVAGGNATIGDAPLVKRFAADQDVERAILRPLPVFLRTDSDRKLAALVLLQQLVPLVNVEVGIVAIGMHCPTLRAFHLDIDGLHGIVSHREVQRSDAHRNRDADIVRIDVGQRVVLRHILRHRLTAHKHQERQG